MQELLQVIVKRIRAIEDAYHESTRALERVEAKLVDLEKRSAPDSPAEILARMNELEGRVAAAERAAGDVPALASRLFVLDKRTAAQQQQLESSNVLPTRIDELAQVVADLHSAQRSFADAAADGPKQLRQSLDIIDERVQALEAAVGDGHAMADHVIAHEAQITALEHQSGEQSTSLGNLEEQLSTLARQFDIVERQLGTHRSDMNALEEKVDVNDLETQFRAAEERQSAAVAELKAKMAELESKASHTADTEKLNVLDARLASLSERIEAVHSLHNDVVDNAQQLSVLREKVEHADMGRIDGLLERLAGLDRLAGDVAALEGQLATLTDARPAASPDLEARVEGMAHQVKELQQSSGMLDSIRTLLAASDIENSFEEIRERVAKLDAQIATLFTLQRMTAESADVVSIESD